jgi:ATP-binding cassette, subfamily B, bacterial PglK
LTPGEPQLRPTRKLWALLTPHERRSVPGLVLLMLVGLALEVLSVGLVMPVVALLTERGPELRLPGMGLVVDAFAGVPRATMIAGMMVFLVFLFFLKALFLWFVTWRHMRFTHHLEVDLAQRLLRIYLAQPYTFHLQRNSARLLNNVVIESNMVAEVGVAPLLVVVAEGLVLLGLGVLLLLVEPAGAISVAVSVGAAAWLVHALMRRGVTRWGEARQRHAELSVQHLQQGLGAVKDILLLGRESEFLERYLQHNSRKARAAQNQATVQRLPRLVLELFVITGMAALTITLLARGSAPDMIVPTLGLFAVAAFRVMPSVTRIMNSLQMMRYAAPAIDALHADLQTLVPAAGGDEESIALKDAIRLEHVSFTYPGAARKALDDVSLVVVRGDTVGIVGASGAGKTTLVDVLLGLLDPDVGAALVDGRDIRIARRSWQSQIGYVPQSIFLTDDTLRRNVAFGLSDLEIDEAAVQRAIGSAQLSEFVAQCPAGLDTRVGERGVKLSGGQRQRIGLARALYHDPEVLVLDEATSALDTEMEAEVLAAVRALHRDKTVVLVAHRSSTVLHCDRLYKLQHGRVVQAGSVDEVLVRDRGD